MRAAERIDGRIMQRSEPIKKRYPLVIVSAMLMLLGACAAPPPRPHSEASPTQLWQARRMALREMSDWGVAGRIAVKQGRKAWQAHIIACWHADGAYTLEFLSLFGQQLARLEAVPGAVTLYLSGGRRFTAHDPDQLLKAQLGWSVPLQGLASWVRGLPVADRPVVRELDQAGRITRLSQQGWAITYPRYRDDMPQKLDFRRQNLRLQLVVDRWLARAQCSSR